MKSIKSKLIKKYTAYVSRELNQMGRVRLLEIDSDLGLEAYIQLELSWDGFSPTADESDLVLEMADAGEMTLIDKKISKRVRVDNQL